MISELTGLILAISGLLKIVLEFKKFGKSKKGKTLPESGKKEKTAKNPILKEWLFWLGVGGIVWGFGSLTLMAFLPAHAATSRDIAGAALNTITMLLSFVNILGAAAFAREKNADFIVNN